MTVFEDRRYEYDIHGRMSSKRGGRHTEQEFRYDGEHRIREVQTVRNGVRQAVYFDYDALGRRTGSEMRLARRASCGTVYGWYRNSEGRQRCHLCV